MAPFDQELAFAHELADRAADIGLEVFAGDFEVRQKEDRSPVTEGDTRIEAMIREALAGRFPGDAILGEEGGLDGSGARMWIIDPIDGTRNFAARIPIWATLIAFSVDGRTTVGLASAPALGERYAATREGGATMNERSIHVSGVSTVAGALVSIADMGAWLGRAAADGQTWGQSALARR